MPSFLFLLQPLMGATTPPTVGGDAAKALAERTLRSLLIGVLLWLVLFSATVLPFVALRKGAGFALVAVFTFLILTSLFYLNRGHVKLASWIFLSCMWFMVTLLLLFSGGITNRGTMFYVAISVTAAWLVGQRVALISASLFVGMALILALLEVAGVSFPRYFLGSPITVWMLVVLFTAIAILPVNQILSSLDEALKQTRESVEDLKQRELALRESEDRCRLAMETGRMFAFEWSLLTDEVQRFGCADIFGLNGNGTRETGRDFLQRIHPDDREALIQAIKTLTPAKDSHKTEYRVIHSSGKMVTLQESGRALFDIDGRIVRLVGITADVTERRRDEAALRESEERFRRVFEEGPIGLALVGKDYHFLKVNSALCQMVGYSETELLQRSFVDITHPDDLLADVELAERLFRREIPFYQLRKRYVKKNGEIIWFDLTASVIRDQEGEPIHGLAMIEDITEIKRAEEVENQLASELAASRDEIRALAASLLTAQDEERRRISRELHDQICQQLAALTLDIDGLAAGPLSPQNARARLKAIRAGVIKAVEETRHIAYQLHPSVLDDLGLVASLEELCLLFSDRYPDIALGFEDSGLPTPVPSEMASCLYSVAKESLQNMAKHSNAKNVSIALGFKKGAVMLTIQDDGSGFNPKTVRSHGGLGLIGIEERVRLVKGKLTVTAQPGRGAQIGVVIPLPSRNL